MKPLFFVGTRRSGTSLVAAVLNEHPHVYVASESDTLWWIYSGGSSEWQEDDRRLGTKPIRYYHPEYFLTDLPDSPREAFFADLLHVKDFGLPEYQDHYPEKMSDHLLYVGEKKPAHRLAPGMREWVEHHFPDAKHLHLVRHPQLTIASMAALGWASGNIEFLTKRWITLQRAALAIEDRLFVRYEDLCAATTSVMSSIFSYLEIDPNLFPARTDTEGRIVMKRGTVMGAEYAWEPRRGNPNLVPVTGELAELMDILGYSVRDW